MSNPVRVSRCLLIAAIALGASACDDDKDKTATAPSASAVAAATPTPPPAPPPKPKPLPDNKDCPDGSKGPGTFNKPCVASGDARMMEVTWTGKMDDKGPSFRIVNTSKLPILYGKLWVYFYDKAGKQLDAKDAGKHKAKECAGDIFAGPMKPGEKAVITFSCVKKDNVPDDAKSIQGELETVGFTDDAGKKNLFYWTNKDLVPDERPIDKGKKKGKK